jgi:hypothetical protein
MLDKHRRMSRDIHHSTMNPIRESKLTGMARALRESKLTGMVSVELGFKAEGISGSLKFKRELSEKEAEFCKDVIDTALINALACLKNRVDQSPSEIPKLPQGSERVKRAS